MDLHAQKTDLRPFLTILGTHMRAKVGFWRPRRQNNETNDAIVNAVRAMQARINFILSDLQLFIVFSEE